MAIYLDENMVGGDPNTIVYPRLLLCMGVTALMSNGTLIGAHVSDAGSEGAVLTKLASEFGLLAPVHLYCTGNTQNHKGKTVPEKAVALGFHGKAYLFDTPDYPDGTFVRITSNGANHKCSIEYKRDDKVAYQTGNGVAVLELKGGVFKAGWHNVTTLKSGAKVHKPHAVNFASKALQVKEYDIP